MARFDGPRTTSSVKPCYLGSVGESGPGRTEPSLRVGAKGDRTLVRGKFKDVREAQPREEDIISLEA